MQEQAKKPEFKIKSGIAYTKNGEKASPFIQSMYKLAKKQSQEKPKKGYTIATKDHNGGLLEVMSITHTDL